jgi:PncC family amidohydrolase
MHDPQTIFTLGARAGALLKSRGETIAIAETSAGGLISASLLAVPGASAYFIGGAVTYSKRAVTALAGIEIAQLRAAGIRSSTEPYAARLAAAIRARYAAGGAINQPSWGLAESGAAGPAGNGYGDPAGHTCLAVSGPVERTATLRTGLADRAANMWLFAEAALALLIEALHAAPPNNQT